MRGTIRLFRAAPGPTGLGPIVSRFCRDSGVLTAFDDAALVSLAALRPDDECEVVSFPALVQKALTATGEPCRWLASAGHQQAAIAQALAERPRDSVFGGGVNQPGYLKRAADAVGMGAAANWTQSPEQQQVEQAQRDFVNATLRRESGAAISEGEFASARQQYFPQPGDSPQVIEQKRKNRELATQGFLAEVPDSANRVQQVLGAAGQSAAAAGAAGNAAAPSLPAGMSRQVGTSGGKPVYEDAQGRRFIGG